MAALRRITIRENPNVPLHDTHPRCHTHTHTAGLLWAHLRFLLIVFVQKSLDAGAIFRMDITEVLNLKANENHVNITLAPCHTSPQCLLHGTYSRGDEARVHRRQSHTAFNSAEEDLGPGCVLAEQPWISHSSELQHPLSWNRGDSQVYLI